MNFAVERFGGLDCVVNIAGAGGEGEPIAQTSVEGFDRSIALLLRGPFLGVKYAVPHMQSGGTITNIASVSGMVAGFAPARLYCSEVRCCRADEIRGFGTRGASFASRWPSV
jgi:NAD(P)-dependent dehydrogenase (short-subunit alcohol dehydrogenase family)